MSEQSTEPIPDAYAEHVERLRKEREQESDPFFDLRGLSEDAMEFIAILCEKSVAQTPRMQVAKNEVERALRTAVQDSLAASQRPEKTEAVRYDYVDSG